VDDYEAKIDEQYLATKILIVQKSKGMSPAEVMAMRDLIEYLEQASDAIVRTADYIRILAAEELSSKNG
jgi:uncharacterized protein Yka (UPF0111/DUF47 family)